MFDPWLLRAANGVPGLTPPAGDPTLVFAEGMEPPTVGGAKLRCCAPPPNGSFPDPSDTIWGGRVLRGGVVVRCGFCFRSLLLGLAARVGYVIFL